MKIKVVIPCFYNKTEHRKFMHVHIFLFGNWKNRSMHWNLTKYLTCRKYLSDIFGKFNDFLLSDLTRLNFCSICSKNSRKIRQLPDNLPIIQKYPIITCNCARESEIAKYPKLHESSKLSRNYLKTQNFKNHKFAWKLKTTRRAKITRKTNNGKLEIARNFPKIWNYTKACNYQNYPKVNKK